MKKAPRSEQEIFTDLSVLCVRPGYVHAVAYLCFRDHIIHSAGAMKEADMAGMFSPSRILRTEINTLLGLLVKAPIDWSVPAQEVRREYWEESERLLEELHDRLSEGVAEGLTKKGPKNGTSDPLSVGELLREPIFYSGEGTYTFQYLDLAPRKYAADALWLEANRGFTIDQASLVAKAVELVQADNADVIRERMRKLHPDERTMLPLFAFAAADVAKKADLAVDLVERILGAFQLPGTERNAAFKSVHDFNVVAAVPLLRMPGGEFLSLQSYSLAEAIYESPFYWMLQDKAYLPTLDKNRGDFTETFVAERLALVFGLENVHLNVDIFETQATKVSDIDVLVVWGNRVVIVQAKSKRLTLEARKGNDQSIRDDFKKAVQMAYDQGVACARCLLDKRYKIVAADGSEMTLPHRIQEIYLFCVVGDYYPALNFQARQFLRTESVERVRSPLVTDVFTIDAMTEMLQTPLQFLSYVTRRANYAEQIVASHELTILGYHLKHNLWVQPGVNLVEISNDSIAGLNIAMAVRRTGIEGAATPDGILTRFGKKTIGRIVKEIEARREPATIDLGFMLLEMNEQCVTEANRAVDRVAAHARTDGKAHNTSVCLEDGSGITFHITGDPGRVAAPRLESYCQRRKYKGRAHRWFGVCMSPDGPNVRFGVSLTFPWVEDAEMDDRTRDMATPLPIDQAFRTVLGANRRAKRAGRNDICPCGSGRKYKKCCLN